MLSTPPPLSDYWMRGLDFTRRLPPDLFQSGDDVRDTPYVSAVRTSLEELSLSAVFCVNGVPTVVFRESHEYEPAEVRHIHAALWNQGLASVFVDLTDDTVRVFSLARVGTGSDENRLTESRLFDPLHLTASTFETLRGLISGAETGRLWEEHSSYFRPQERIDAVLLHNLDAAHNMLQESELPPDQSAAALIQTMFVAYLEDRKIIGQDYFANATDGEYRNWSSLLGSGDVPALERLFSALHSDFNGDLFAAPCSFSGADPEVFLTSEHLTVLKRFRVGQEKMARSGHGQLRFWGYDFRYIPIEIISEVYDRFLRRGPVSESSVGAYYTPMFLTDTVISSMWTFLSDTQKDHGAFLDPACGSGIFLVKTFQRLCQRWRALNPTKPKIPWDTLAAILRRVHGQDINPTAIRISAFSLYLALLEQVRPPDLRALFASGRRLPALCDHTLRDSDFFSEDSGFPNVDVILGNPPWSSRKGSNVTHVQWTRARDYPLPSLEAAWAFAWKALEGLSERGVVAFLLPAMGFLHNRSTKCIDARIRLFALCRVRVVVDLSDLRYQLFTKARRSTALIVLCKSSGPEGIPYEFDYLTPKADLSLRTKRFISVTSQDRARLRSSDLVQNRRLFSQRLCLHSSEVGLFSYLGRLPRMASFVEQYSKDRRGSQWRIGVGFQPWRASKASGSSQRPVESAQIREYPFLPAREFAPLAIDQAKLKPPKSNSARRRGFEAAFRGSRILVRCGIGMSEGRIRAAFVEKPLTFWDSIMGITVPENEQAIGKFIAAYLNSHLALWFAFHETASLGSERPLIRPSDLLQLPLPLPDDLLDPDSARTIRSNVVEIVDRVGSDSREVLASNTSITATLAQIDALIYKYFGLNDDERALVEEAVEYRFPSVQPSRRAFPSVWHETSPDDRRAYARAVQRRLTGWFTDNRSPAVRLVARNNDYAIIELSVGPRRRDTDYSEGDLRVYATALAELTDRLPGTKGRNFALTPDVRIFAGGRLFLIKPLQKRYWLLSAAMADSDAIVSDLDYLWHQGGHETLPS